MVPGRGIWDLIFPAASEAAEDRGDAVGSCVQDSLCRGAARKPAVGWGAGTVRDRACGCAEHPEGTGVRKEMGIDLKTKRC